MSSVILDYEIPHSYTKCANDAEIKKAIDPLYPKFNRLLKFNIQFHIFFIFLLLSEIVTFIVLFKFLSDSALLAISFGVIFLTLFAYLILRLYFQSQKPLQFNELKKSYEKSCKTLISYEEGNVDKHVTLANAFCKLANSLHKKERQYFKLPKVFAKKMTNFNKLLENFSSWWLYEDVHFVKELLLTTAVNEHIKVVKCEPTSQNAHAALANAYVMLSGLYAGFQKSNHFGEEKLFLSPRFLKEMEEKFKLTAERAIEEFKVLCDLKPDDPWVHKQLGYSYHDLKMPFEEIKEYEIVLKINPEDKDTLYKLGVLYFQQGFNAKGLKLYEELKKTNPKKADQLIKFYAVYTPF